jgi:hypothetical protein
MKTSPSVSTLCRRLLSRRPPHGARRARRARSFQPGVEGLEDRTVLSLPPFAPQFGPATGFSDGGGKLVGNVPVYLIFADPNGTATFGNDPAHPLAISDITQAVTTILNSGYFDGLSQYGVDLFGFHIGFHPYLAGTYVNTDYQLPKTFKANNDNSDGGNNSDINNLVSDSLQDNRNDNNGLPEPDATDTNGIYAVFTPDGYQLQSVMNHTTLYPAGIHSDGDTGGFLDSDDADDLVIPTSVIQQAQPPSLRGTNPPQTTPLPTPMDSVTATFSHELVEDLTDPVSQGGGIGVGPGASYLPGFPFYQRGPAEIADNEAQLYVGYENGVAVQSYWSQQDNAFVIPGPSATQNRFALNNQRLVVSGGVSGSMTNTSVRIGSTGSGGVQVVVNGEAVEYGPGQVTSIDVSLAGGTNTVDLHAVPSGVTSITVEGAGNTTLEAPSGTSNVWHNLGAGSGTLDIGSQVGIVTFSGVTNETGGGTDDFKFEGGSVPGSIDGGAGPGVATLDYSAVSGPVTVNLQAGTADDIGLTFRNINNFVGSGNSGDTLVGPDATWDINGANAGSVNGLTFSSFENLTGGSGNDRFVFLPGGSISGNLDGGGGGNTLDYSNLTTSVTLNLQGHTATGIGGTFANITNFIGGSGVNSVVGPDAASVWAVTGPNTFTVDGLTFSAIQNIVGGAGPDRFMIQTGGSLSGSIDGGGGNTLDYSSYNGDILVDLALGTATGIAQGVVGIQNVTGSMGNSMLVGDGNANVLTGGVGRNVIIGGGGPDTLIDGGGDNILIAGFTVYDQDLTALQAIMAEWDRTDLSFEQRLAHLISEGRNDNRLNGSYVLNKKTVFTDGASDSVIGGAGLDWVFMDRKTATFANRKPGDHITEL